MSLLIFNIRSSSSGNASYIGNENEGILIDCGVSAKCVTSSLYEVGLKPNCIKGILISHEHSDHINGIKVLGKQLDVPIYSSEGTMSYMEQRDKLPLHAKKHIIQDGESFFLGNMEILPFSIPHDANEPLAFKCFIKGKTASFVTDLGHLSKKVFSILEGSDFLLIESNHDLDMLQNTPKYPSYLKKRILSRKGHLSNIECAYNVLRLCQKGTKHILLGHLSQNTNTYDIAYHTTHHNLCTANAEEHVDFTLHVARHDSYSKIYNL